MRIAIIGSGIAGNVAAHHLQREHDITVFEADSHVGGHTHTHCVEQNGRHFQVDTGFIVFNDRTYPNFIHLLNELEVPSQPSNMSFSVKCARTGLEYNGTSINSLFAQRRNVLRPSFWRMVHDILRFNKEAPGLLQANAPEISLGEYLRQGCYSQGFIAHYIVPMGAAIWSTAPDAIREMPAPYFVRFFHNHGMLSVGDRPQWRVIQGGSARYVEKLIAQPGDKLPVGTPLAFIHVEGEAASPSRPEAKPEAPVLETPNWFMRRPAISRT